MAGSRRSTDPKRVEWHARHRRLAHSRDSTVFDLNFSGDNLFPAQPRRLETSSLGKKVFVDYGYGGGLNNAGTLSVTNSRFNGNAAMGVYGSFGGGFADSGTMSIFYVTAENNSAATGGGVAITSGTQSVVNSIDSIYQNTQGGSVSVAAGNHNAGRVSRGCGPAGYRLRDVV
jgi:hypothetical protein